MVHFDAKKIILENKPDFINKPQIVQKITYSFFSKLLHFQDLNNLFSKYHDHYGIKFIDSYFDMLNFSYRISHLDYKRIPSEGRLICVSNHPIGSLDGLALVKAISEIRKDVKIVANDMLMRLENITECFLPYRLDSKVAQKKNLLAIARALENEEAVIMFPAAEVSRPKWFKIYDGRWTKGAVFFAKKFDVPILPIHVIAKNSFLFNLVSIISKPLSTLLLPREAFNKRDTIINIFIGDPIPAKAFSESHINDNEQIKLLKKHCYSLGNNHRRPIFTTQKNIIHPIDRKLIKKELLNAKSLGKTNDNKKIYLTDMDSSPNILEEIARLREVTFRKVGEGTGRIMDLDIYDKYYKHLIVWDEDELEIVGAYRLGIGIDIMEKYGKKGFYTSSLFEFSDDFTDNYLNYSVEMGRSFIQKKYWNSKALHLLWQGIGAYLAANKQIKYLFGPVSISNSYPIAAKEMIIYYYSKWYGSRKNLAKSFQKYKMKDEAVKKLTELFSSNSHEKDYKILKRMLKPFGFSVPILYKHYSDLCEYGGALYLDFGIDDSFEKCVDGFLVVELQKVKKEKFDRYVKPYLKENLS